MNIAIVELQRDLLLNQLMELEETLNSKGVRLGMKGYTIFLQNGVYYVKYTDLQTKKQIPAKRSLRTTSREEAEILAKKYRESILTSYYAKKNGVRDIIAFFSDYYKVEKSPHLQEQLKNKERKIGETQIKKYDGFINQHFIDFLQKNKITKLVEITLKKLKEFQTYLVDKGLSPKTINDRINGAVKPIFSTLHIKGLISSTPFTKNLDFTFNLPTSTDRKIRHILPIYETLAILMNSEMWKLYKTEKDVKSGNISNEKHYKKYRLLCLLIATCGLRDAEIFMLRKENIIKIRRTWFIDVVNSHIGEQGLKTESSKRKVPIPKITLQALNEYIQENDITDYIFYRGSKIINQHIFFLANKQLGIHCGHTEEELKEKNINFYSLRHLYKTMLNRSEIKEDIIEYFMGHAVNVNRMNERYNNKEDLDDIFFEENGIKVNDYISDLFNKVFDRYGYLPCEENTSMEQVELTDNNGRKHSYFTNVLVKIDYEKEILYFFDDLLSKGILPRTNNKQEIIEALDDLLKSETINKRQYDDCIYCMEVYGIENTNLFDA